MLLKHTVLAAALAAASLAAHADNGSILYANPGPLNSFGFNSVGFNGTSGDILSLTFDLSDTASELTFGGLNSLDTTLLFGGTASVFGTVGSQVFGFNFNGFNPYETFRFSWDPDTIGDANYGATVGELVGAKVTAIVSIGGELVKYTDTVEAVGRDVAANLYPTGIVPEPDTYALLLAGLSAVGFLARRQRTR